MSRNVWAILTGEYPPQPGGVSDYTFLVAQRLAQAGDDVYVWAPEVEAPTPFQTGVHVHRLPGSFGVRALSLLKKQLGRVPQPFQLLVQYVPHAYGFKAMNLAFAAWLYANRREKPWVMFHEVAFDLKPMQPLKHNVLGLATNAMAALVARAAKQSFVAIPEWETRLRVLAPGDRTIHILPVPSNIPTHVNLSQVADARMQIAPKRQSTVIGHFGTYGDHVAPLVCKVFPKLLVGEEQRIGVFFGRGGREFAAKFVDEHPDLRDRIAATGGLPSRSLAAHLAACDLLIQPYPDGASSRRGSLMAGLGLGLPIVTTDGSFTEPHWRESGAVALAPAGDTIRMIDLAEALLRDANARQRLSTNASALYAQMFSIDNTIRVLRSTAENGVASG